MKKKGIIIAVVAVLVLLLAVGTVWFLNKDKNELGTGDESTIITLDINPSVELELKKGNVIRATALNEDAKDYVVGLEGKSLDDSFSTIIKKAKDNNLVEDGNVTIILGMENKNSKIEESLKKACNNNEVTGNIIVPVITEEAKREAEAKGVTAAKAAYVLEVVKENTNLQFEEVVKKSSEEITEMKTTGKYCDEGYTLKGNRCEKLVKEEVATTSKTCPTGYEFINDKCYEQVSATQEPYCKNGLTLKNNKCVGTENVDATGTCATGTYNSKTGKCEVLTEAGTATKKCPKSEQKLLSNGRCASPHMGAHFDDPEGVIDPATECCCGDVWYPDSSIPSRGWCYSPAGNDDPVETCPSGQTLKDGKCYKAETSDATYSCSKGTLEGSKCLVETSKNPDYKLGCTSGLELYKDRICIDYSKTVDTIIGYVCKDEARLVGDKCLYYEVVDAKE